MKRWFAFLLALTLALCPALLAQAESGTPLAQADVDSLVNNGLNTMGDYVNKYAPTYYSWYYDGDETGMTIFMLDIDGGTLTLGVKDATDYQDDDVGGVGTDTLPSDALGLQAGFYGVTWDTEDMTSIPMPRGLKIGDTQEQLTAAISGLQEDQSDDSTDSGDNSTTFSAVVNIPDSQLNEYYEFDFFLTDGVITSGQMERTYDS